MQKFTLKVEYRHGPGCQGCGCVQFRWVPLGTDRPLELHHVVEEDEYSKWIQSINQLINQENVFLQGGKATGLVFSAVFCICSFGLSFLFCYATDCCRLKSSTDRLWQAIRDVLPGKNQTENRGFEINVWRVTTAAGYFEIHIEFNYNTQIVGLKTTHAPAPVVMNDGPGFNKTSLIERISSWSVDDVCAHFLNFGASQEVLQKIREEQVNGAALIGLSEVSLKELGLKIGQIGQHQAFMKG